MTHAEYHRALEAASREYEKLGEERRRIDERLAQLAQTIGTLNRLCGFVPTVFWGFTDACRVVLKGTAHPMTPVEVRDRLGAIGFDLSKYTNPLAAIHTVLKRLGEAKEVGFVEIAGGKFAYEWLQAARAPLVLNERELAELVSEGDLSGLESRAAAKAKKRRKK